MRLATFTVACAAAGFLIFASQRCSFRSEANHAAFSANHQRDSQPNRQSETNGRIGKVHGEPSPLHGRNAPSLSESVELKHFQFRDPAAKQASQVIKETITRWELKRTKEFKRGTLTQEDSAASYSTLVIKRPSNDDITELVGQLKQILELYAGSEGQELAEFSDYYQEVFSAFDGEYRMVTCQLTTMNETRSEHTLHIISDYTGQDGIEMESNGMPSKPVKANTLVRATMGGTPSNWRYAHLFPLSEVP